MKKNTDATKPETTDQSLETVLSREEENAEIPVKIMLLREMQRHIYIRAPIDEVLLSILGNPNPPRSLWTITRLGTSDVFYIRSYPETHLYMTYAPEMVNKVQARAYSGNDDQKWIFTDIEPARGTYYICNIVRGNTYLTVHAENSSAINTTVYYGSSSQQFAVHAV